METWFVKRQVARKCPSHLLGKLLEWKRQWRTTGTYATGTSHLLGKLLEWKLDNHAYHTCWSLKLFPLAGKTT
ncbi:MAG: hypothetical protein F6J96_19970 [Symploca sp. SIO1C2]|nr:hypothetical protein [Symploca sp. SIO1C2]